MTRTIKVIYDRSNRRYEILVNDKHGDFKNLQHGSGRFKSNIYRDTLQGAKDYANRKAKFYKDLFNANVRVIIAL